MCVVVVAAAKWKCELWLEETDDGDNDRREPRVPESGAGTNLIISATWQTLMTPNCCRRCCCCCHCYMYSVHICANSCAFNRSLLSVNFCKFTAHTSTMFINKYENKKRKPKSPIDSQPIEHVRRISPKNALEKIYSQYTFTFAWIRTHYTKANWRHRPRDDTIYTCAHPHTHTCMRPLPLTHIQENHSHSNYTTRCSKQKTADRRRCHLTYKYNHRTEQKQKQKQK